MSPSKRKRLYLHPDEGWREEPEGARYRIDSVIETSPKVSNTIYKKTEDGWTPVEHASKQLNAVQAGLWFEVSSSQWGLVRFRCARFLDESFASKMLEGISILDRTGNAIEDIDTAGDTFYLSPEDAKTFSKRVQTAGGAITRGQPGTLGRFPERVEEIDQEVHALNDLLRGDLEVLETEDLGIAERARFDDNGKAFQEKVKQFSQAAAEIEQDLEQEMQQAQETETRAGFLEVRDRVNSAREQVEALRKARTRAENIVAERMRDASKAKTARPEVVTQLLLHDLHGHAEDAGLETAWRDGALYIQCPEGVIEITSDGLRISRVY